MVLGKPDAPKTHFFGIGNLLERLVDALRLAVRGPGFRNLNLIKQADSHWIFSRRAQERALPLTPVARAVSRTMHDAQSSVELIVV
jgi:hypothetical protein